MTNHQARREHGPPRAYAETHVRQVRVAGVMAMVAEFEGDLIRMRTREGMRVAKAKGRLRASSRS